LVADAYDLQRGEMMTRNDTANMALCIFAGNLLSSLVEHGAISRGAAMAVAKEVSENLGEGVEAKKIAKYFAEATRLLGEVA
jgi:hypothetical protein